MAVYAFEAVDGDGRPVREEIDARDRDDAAGKLRDRGLFPTRIREQGASDAAVAAPPRSRRTFTVGGVGLGRLTQFTQQLATLQDAGLPIVRSLRLLEGQQKPGVLKNCLLEVVEDVESGATLSEALAKHPRAFDRLYVGMVRAGEAGGVLDTILDRLTRFLEKSLRLKKKVVGALVYPAVVTLVAVSILAGIMTFVVPAFRTMFEETGVPLPAVTQALIAASNAVADAWFALPLALVLLLLGQRAVASHPAGRHGLDWLTLHAPVFGPILHKSTVSRFCRTLGTLVASGVPILESLSITREATANHVVARAIDDVHASIREGESIAGPLLRSGVFDELLADMVAIGEETGELDKMLNKIADNYDLEVDVAVESLSSIIEPLLILAMGGAVGFIVIALFMPLIDQLKAMG